ncbi:alpha/beta-hydrolase [Sanghuangporus baumii]|uniref:Alpha/beta-hydrolase n=1 Tax=Sanghuangporus baumii TaxID=108892 RepID=A0A9Q5I5C2_SANBA|nr:alpha/beta-hydrolase [Sanghuangporus baumii]
MLPLFVLVACSLAEVVSGNTLERRAISQELLAEFTRFTSLSIAAYQPSCPKPLGTELVLAINNDSTNTQGFIARDDSNKQIIATFRGSQQLEDFVRGYNIWLRVPYSSPGVTETSNATAHIGFLNAYNSVASTILSTIASELQAHPDYTLISTGHSLGASLACLCGLSLASNFPGTPLRVFTFGQPRTGDSAYADLVERLVGVDNIYRAVHTYDGVPTLIPQALGYRHHGTEFWNFEDPSTVDNVKVCSGQEDPTCSDSIPTTGINLAHIYYFGEVIGIGLNPSVCE